MQTFSRLTLRMSRGGEGGGPGPRAVPLLMIPVNVARNGDTLYSVLQPARDKDAHVGYQDVRLS